MNELDELRQKIAKLKGWEVVETKNQNPLLKHDKYYSVRLGVRGTNLYPWPEAAWFEAEAKMIPDWPRNWEAAGELWGEMVVAGKNPSLLCFPDENDNGRITHVVILVNTYQECPFGDTGPEAISRAYVAWKESRNVTQT